MNKTYQKIIEDYRYLRLSAKMHADENYDVALRDEKFKELDQQIRALTIDIAKSDSPSELIQRQKALKSEWKERLLELGMTPQDLTPRHRCRTCKDTGIVDGKICNCVKQILLSRMKQECMTSSISEFTFRDSNPELFTSTRQEKAMTALYKTMREFCEKFPTTKRLNIVLSGEMGVGKTCLLSATANAVMEKGHSVLWLTAFELNNLFLKYHTSPLSERSNILDNVIGCDLLVIDDLGTEPLLKNVTIEYLLVILTERMSKRKHTCFSTNLTSEQILQKYGERIFSRILDKRYTLTRRIVGEDLRIK